MARLTPKLDKLPAPQRLLWPELSNVPSWFTLYGGTTLALRIGHRESAAFDFFANAPFDPDRLASSLPFLHGAERVQVAANTLMCRVERGGPVLLSFFGALGLGQVLVPDLAADIGLNIASLLDIAGTKVAVVQKRAEAKDYTDIATLLENGVDLPTALAAGRVVYGTTFNPLITLKALSYFADISGLPPAIQQRLANAVAMTDPNRLPRLASYRTHPSDTDVTP